MLSGEGTRETKRTCPLSVPTKHRPQLGLHSRALTFSCPSERLPTSLCTSIVHVCRVPSSRTVATMSFPGQMGWTKENLPLDASSYTSKLLVEGWKIKIAPFRVLKAILS